MCIRDSLYRQWDADDAADVAARSPDVLEILSERLHKLLKAGPKSLKDLHEATGRNVRGDLLRAALDILKNKGLAASSKSVGPNGGRPAERWEVSS